MKIAIAQLNPVVGDIGRNSSRIINCAAELSRRAELVVFPELVVTGYPPRDLLDFEWFRSEVRGAVERIARSTESLRGCGVLFGSPVVGARGRERCLYNCAVLAVDGRIVYSQAKTLLPTYDVFDEARYFAPADAVATTPYRGEVLGISICEDAWTDPELNGGKAPSARNPIADIAAQGATMMVNISASPFEQGKEEIRYELLRGHALRYGMPFVYVNQVGGNDDVLFDGRSMVFSGDGKLLALGPSFREWTEVVDVSPASEGMIYRPQERIESIHDALVMGLRDYVHKCGFTKVVIGLSGGIDSALTCCLAVEALGPENVLGITMPSQYSSRGSVEDSEKLASHLGIEFRIVPIAGIHTAYLEALKDAFAGTGSGIAEENIQARIRGNIWMAFANKFGHLALTAGNKSELAVGYCTLYGDMSGALCVLGDVYKTQVYELARYVNRGGEIIPSAIIDKAPSAELRPGQVDQDTLPPYPILDSILYNYIECGLSPSQIIDKGFDSDTVYWVVKAVCRSEYKRRQAAPGLKVSSKAFGVGRRMPIAARY
jgi:NAD+ synthase (glutamine-hydrolysing)